VLIGNRFMWPHHMSAFHSIQQARLMDRIESMNISPQYPLRRHHLLLCQAANTRRLQRERALKTTALRYERNRLGHFPSERSADLPATGALAHSLLVRQWRARVILRCIARHNHASRAATGTSGAICPPIGGSSRVGSACTFGQ